MMGKDKSIRSNMSVNEVAGSLEAKQFKTLLEENCKAQTTIIDGSCKSQCVLFRITSIPLDVLTMIMKLDHILASLKLVLG